jgi:copper oxidase (laccase) domain-containing protein
MFDLSLCVATDLVINGLPKENIEMGNLCTRCNYDHFFSNCVAGMKSKYDQEREGRFAAIVGLLGERL